MSGGGGGGDGGAQQMEDRRQNRVNAAVNMINSIFQGGTGYTGIDRAASYDPTKTYYLADGQVYNPATKSVQRPVSIDDIAYGGIGGIAQNYQDAKSSPMVLDWDMINQEIAAGNLFTGLKKNEGGGRGQMYDQQRQAVTDLNRRDVDRQFLDAERQNRFGLARAGLSGGSADIDSNAELQRRTNEGLIKAAGIGDQAAADLQTADERSRQNLISMAQSGIDTGQAAQMALSQLDANSANAASARSGATIGNLFGDLSQAYLYGQQQQGVRAGAAPYQQWQPGISNSPQKGYSGSTA